MLGAVSGCLDAWLEHLRDRVRMSPAGGRFAEDPFAQVVVARAASEVASAWLQLGGNLDALYAAACAGTGPVDLGLRLRTRRDQVLGAERAIRAVEMLFKTAGGNSLNRGNPIERAGGTSTPAACTWPTTWSGRWPPTASTRSAFRPRSTWSDHGG